MISELLGNSFNKILCPINIDLIGGIIERLCSPAERKEFTSRRLDFRIGGEI